MKGMDVILNGSADELQKYIESFSPFSSQQAQVAKSRISNDPTAGLGNAPPCANYHKLMLFAEWELMIDGVHECEQAEELKEKRRNFLSCKGIFLEIQKALQKASCDFETGRK